jgi:hypothetical protein
MNNVGHRNNYDLNKKCNGGKVVFNCEVITAAKDVTVVWRLPFVSRRHFGVRELHGVAEEPTASILSVMAPLPA